MRDAERTLVFNASAPQDPMRQVVRMRRGLMQKRELAWDHFCLKRHETLGRERNYMTHTSKSETIPYLLNQMFPSNDFPWNIYIYEGNHRIRVLSVQKTLSITDVHILRAQ